MGLRGGGRHEGVGRAGDVGLQGGGERSGENDLDGVVVGETRLAVSRAGVGRGAGALGREAGRPGGDGERAAAAVRRQVVVGWTERERARRRGAGGRDEGDVSLSVASKGLDGRERGRLATTADATNDAVESGESDEPADDAEHDDDGERRGLVAALWVHVSAVNKQAWAWGRRLSPPTTSMRTPSLASATSSTARQQPALARRLLFPALAPGSDLPPLFVSPACPPELDAEAYDLLALALRAHVGSWWTKLTRYDRDLLPQLALVLTHVLRVLEQRLVAADLATFAFCDVPALLAAHYADHRHALAKLSTSYATGGALSRLRLFHQLQPHLAVAADGTVDEEYFRHALDLVLGICLPPEDHAPDVERTIARDVLLQLVVEHVLPRVSQPWYIHKTLLDLLGPSPEPPSKVDAPLLSSPPLTSRQPPHGLLVLLLSVVQSLSGACLALIHAYKHTIQTIKLVNRSASAKPSVSTPSTMSRASSTSSISTTPLVETPQDLVRGPLLLFARVFRIRDRFSSAIPFDLVFMMCSFFNPFLNRYVCPFHPERWSQCVFSYLSYMLYERMLSVSSILSLVRLSKHALFPNGYPGSPLVEPSVEEQATIRRQLARRMSELIPPYTSAVLLGPSPAASLDAAIEPLEDSACNLHLAVFLFDAVLLTVFPELARA